MGVAEREHEPLELRHVQRGGRAFARDVGHEHAELARTDFEEVVVVPAHFARRLAEIRDAEAVDRRRLDRQQRLLNLARDAQLVVEPLLLALDVQQVLDARAHAVERLGEIAQLVARRDVDAVREVALLDPLRAREELVHGGRDHTRERRAHEERRALDDQEQHAPPRQRRRETRSSVLAVAGEALRRLGGHDLS